MNKSFKLTRFPNKVKITLLWNYYNLNLILIYILYAWASETWDREITS